MTVRDEVNEIIDTLIPTHGEFTVSDIAQKFIGQMQETAPVLFDDFKEDLALSAIREYIQHRLADQRATARRAMMTRDYSEDTLDIDRIKKGMSTFDITFVVDEQNTRKHLADMTGADHRFVAVSYENQGKQKLLMAAFHRTIADRIGKKSTAAVVTEEQYEIAYQAIVGKQIK